MSVPFGLDIDKLNELLSGNLGIADAIHKASITPISDSIKVSKDKQTFDRVSTPDQMSGLPAIEKTIISSMLESQKPFIEIAKVCLELFGQLGYVLAVLKGGQNPENDPSSSLNAFQQSKSKLSSFKTGFEPKPSNEQTPTNLAVPTDIFLGKWKRDVVDVGSFYSIDPNQDELSGRVSINEKNWPQYTSFDDYTSSELADLQPMLVGLDEETTQDAVNGRTDSLSDEWDELENNNQLLKKYKNDLLDDHLYHAYSQQNVTYLNNQVSVDVESDYDVNISKYVNQDSTNPYETVTITAKLKQQQTVGKKNPDSFPGGQTARAARALVKRAVPILTQKFFPVLNQFKKLMQDPNSFLGDVMVTKLKQNFQMFDASLKDRNVFDKDRSKYWSGNKFVLDGITGIDIGLLKMTIGIKDAVPSFSPGSTKNDQSKENSMVKMVMNLVAMPINFLKGVLDFFVGISKKIFKIKEIPGIVQDTLSFDWIKNLLKFPKLLEFLGAVDGDVTKIPMLNVPKDGNLKLVPQMLEGFLKTILGFINGFLQIPNAIVGSQLVPPITI